jgi:hypothetical protein
MKNYSLWTLKKCLEIAKYHTPKDTGVMRNIATRQWVFPDVTIIRWLSSIAPYIKYQQEGTRFSTKNKGFIDRAYLDIAMLLTLQAGVSKGEQTKRYNNFSSKESAYFGQKFKTREQEMRMQKRREKQIEQVQKGLVDEDTLKNYKEIASEVARRERRFRRNIGMFIDREDD